MKKRYNIQYLLALMFTLALVGCSNEDFLTTQSDETRVMSFSVGTDMPKITSKAADGYRDWADGDPTSIGAFGYYDNDYSKTAVFFNNTNVTWDSGEGKWTYTPLKYWADYTWCKSFDFFGYMPYNADATLTQGTGDDANKYTLSFRVEFSDAVVSVANKANIPLICHLPIHKTVVGEVIDYQMDQVLTGFNLQFKMGEQMSELRDFVIKEVKVTGAASTLAKAGTVSRTYTYNASAGTWSAGSVMWSSLTKKAEAVEYPVPFVDHGDGAADDPYDATNSTLRVGYSFKDVTSQWGSNFYAIPSAEFTPTITVKYDVTVRDEAGNYITTRENITSTVQFSSGYFDNYAVGQTGKVNSIIVQIVPDYLYVLADADQRASWIIVQD